MKTKHPHTFTDIPENHWARDAISALQSNKVAVGTGDGKFQPEMLVTRGQFAKFYNDQLIILRENGIDREKAHNV